jgi:hypothetical protein
MMATTSANRYIVEELTFLLQADEPCTDVNS